MKIRWIGHASFQIETSGGLRIRTDPYDESLGLPISDLPADVVTVSHDHFDHNAVGLVKGRPRLLTGLQDATIADAHIRSLATFHDDSGGSRRGGNTVFIIEDDGLVLAHLGDLGHLLTTQQAAGLGHVDVLCLPVGGKYTIDADQATALADKTKPLITIPMHYSIPGLQVDIAPVDSFLLGKNTTRTQELDVTAANVPEKPVVVVLAPRP